MKYLMVGLLIGFTAVTFAGELQHDRMKTCPYGWHMTAECIVDTGYQKCTSNPDEGLSAKCILREGSLNCPCEKINDALEGSQESQSKVP